VGGLECKSVNGEEKLEVLRRVVDDSSVGLKDSYCSE
jgi:hypothetical protein